MRLVNRINNFINRSKQFNIPVAIAIRKQVLSGVKTPEYIRTISSYMDKELKSVINKYKNEQLVYSEKVDRKDQNHVWVCWWQGERNMPEIIRVCYARLKYYASADNLNLHLITSDNYRNFVEIPDVFIQKYNDHKITMTHLSDILRFLLLEKYGGYWVDSTVLFTDRIPDKYFSHRLYCQKMEHYDGYEFRENEASGSRWCGFSIGGEKHNILFRFINDSFIVYWQNHDYIIDYVLLDSVILSGYKNVPAIKALIDSIRDNNEDIFEMRKIINDCYTKDLYNRITKRKVMHKITYKMKLKKINDKQMLTMYGFIYDETCQKYDLKS